MWQKKDKGLLTVKSFKGNANELKRAKYILAFLQTGSIAYACKVSGLSAKAHSRIEECSSRRPQGPPTPATTLLGSTRQRTARRRECGSQPQE